MLTADSKKWLTELKPGDRVFVESPMGRELRPLWVVRRTATQIVASIDSPEDGKQQRETKFKADTGWETGQAHGSRYMLLEATPERVAEYDGQQLANEVRGRTFDLSEAAREYQQGRTNAKQFTVEELRKILDLISTLNIPKAD